MNSPEEKKNQLADAVAIHLVPSPMAFPCHDGAVSDHAEKLPCIYVLKFANQHTTHNLRSSEYSAMHLNIGVYGEGWRKGHE